MIKEVTGSTMHIQFVLYGWVALSIVSSVGLRSVDESTYQLTVVPNSNSFFKVKDKNSSSKNN